MQASGTDRSDLERADSLYFFPDTPISAGQLRHLLAHGSAERRAWALSHLLRYADWDDIWVFVTRDQVRDLLGQLDLPAGLRAAWARILKVEEVPSGGGP
jgi:hypothetical protein